MTWLGLTADYGPREHAFMRQLRVGGASREELAVIHTLTALLDAHLDEVAQPRTLRQERAA